MLKGFIFALGKKLSGETASLVITIMSEYFQKKHDCWSASFDLTTNLRDHDLERNCTIANARSFQQFDDFEAFPKHLGEMHGNNFRPTETGFWVAQEALQAY